MGSVRKKSEAPAEHVDTESENEGSTKRTRKGDDFSGYEQIRDQRIKENMERMHKLGLLDLSLKLKQQNKKPQEKKKTTHNELPPTRRSSRFATPFALYSLFQVFL